MTGVADARRDRGRSAFLDAPVDPQHLKRYLVGAQAVVLLKLCRSAFGLALLKRSQENVAHAGSLGESALQAHGFQRITLHEDFLPYRSSATISGRSNLRLDLLARRR